MKGVNLADLVVLVMVIALMAVCIRNLIAAGKSGTCSCGKSSCAGCSLCKAAAQRQ